MSAHGHRQHTPEDGTGTPPAAVPPIRIENEPSVKETLEESLDSFDSEVSLGMLDRGARVERTDDLDLFPSEHLDADDVVVDVVPEKVVAPLAVVVADRRAVVVPIEPRVVAAAPERPGVVAGIPQRAPTRATRRLAVVAGIAGCLGLTTVGILLWRSPAPVEEPAAVVRELTSSAAAHAAAQEPIPAPLVAPTPEAPPTLEPATEPEPLMPPAPMAERRDPIATPVSGAETPPLRSELTTRPDGLAAETDVDATESTAAPVAAANTTAAIGTAPPELPVSSPVAEEPLSVTRTPSVDTPVTLSLPVPPMSPPAAPVRAPAATDAGSVTAVTLVPAPARDAEDIQMVLTRYRSAFSDLDATAVSQVWPKADSRALARAFRGLEEQGIAFDNCDIRVAGTNALASCGGTVRYVTKVGSKEPRTEQRRWQFTLGKVRDLWVIQTVESR